jgi:hypothetical protein
MDTRFEVVIIILINIFTTPWTLTNLCIAGK